MLEGPRFQINEGQVLCRARYFQQVFARGGDDVKILRSLATELDSLAVLPEKRLSDTKSLVAVKAECHDGTPTDESSLLQVFALRGATRLGPASGKDSRRPMAYLGDLPVLIGELPLKPA